MEACSRTLQRAMSWPTHPWPRGLALLLIAFTLAAQVSRAASLERVSRRVLQAGQQKPEETRKSLAWLGSQFTFKSKSSCDPTFYHSPLVLNITRPDRSSFCFKVSNKMPEVVKYSCQQAPNANQVSRIQLVIASGCADAIDAVTVDGQPWSSVTYDNASSVLSIERITTLPPADAANPADRTVCVQLKSDHPTCGAASSLCAPSYGPEPACAVLVADSKATCCPVNRVSYADAVIEESPLYRLYGKFNDPEGCETITSEAALLAALGKQYRAALELPSGSIQFLSYNCRNNRLAAVFKVSGLKLDQSETINERSAALLKPLAQALGIVGVRANFYTFPPPSPPLTPRRPPTSPAPTYATQSSPQLPVYGSR
ncbi:hypothetical protein VOLCADRAFT_121081 [Volvox carteri f. nagariensis]|uniref:Pherophorin domain-containing protein n=1 Tax=Volvox carteri f. nagariensis TaxID=3068 RepID=D8U1Y9_VOLCA|nr:uncharacterized protein VOLCADRAFT_121081 [Volvox carteri f. nagariensis]EFJ46267.1 hypothetical protein VOLCADRAFT_121081 [Volvox carteri f. nagariensis]|eukprot:XP_002952714.1 hypothetical protein VOLCADRAFT_121081 [Volvox carteri f. nagariensis]